MLKNKKRYECDDVMTLANKASFSKRCRKIIRIWTSVKGHSVNVLDKNNCYMYNNSYTMYGLFQ